MTIPKIAIILGSTRQGRFGEIPAQWIMEIAANRSDIDVELVDLRDFPMPFFEEPVTSDRAPGASDAVQRWQQRLTEFDGYIFITPEYNHSIPGVLKNALDYAFTQWNRKAAAFVSYGGVGGARAVEQLRLISIELQLVAIKSAVHIAMTDFIAVRDGKPISDIAHLAVGATTMLDDLVWWTNATRAARAAA